MNTSKSKILNLMAGVWVVINLPIPNAYGAFTSIFYRILQHSFIDTRVAFALAAFGVFFLFLLLSKLWIEKYLTWSAILSLVIFIGAALQLMAVQDFLTGHMSSFSGVALVIFAIILCIFIIKAMRGNIKFSIK